MIIEHRTYKIKPGKVNALMDSRKRRNESTQRNSRKSNWIFLYRNRPLNEIVHIWL